MKHAPLVPPGLKALLGSTGWAKLLVQFFLHLGDAFHVRELARLLHESPGSLLRDLRRLEATRLLQTERVGNQVRYSLNRRHPLYTDLHRIIIKTAAADTVLREALQIGPGRRISRTLRLLCEGPGESQSDLDLLIIGDAPARTVRWA